MLRVFFTLLLSLYSQSLLAATPVCPPDLGRSTDDFKVIEAQPVDISGQFGEVQNLDLSAFKGKVVIVRFIGTWCPACKADLQELNRRFLNKKYRSNVEVVLVTNTGPHETSKLVAEFRQKAAARWSVDPNRFHLWFVDSVTTADGTTINGVTRLKEALAPDGTILLPNYKFVPYAAVFDRTGKLRQFGEELLDDKYYDGIEALIKGCSDSKSNKKNR